VDGEGSDEVTGDTGVFVLGAGEEAGETSAIAVSRLLSSEAVVLGGLVLVSLTPTRRSAQLRPRSLLPMLSALPFTRRATLCP